ncbi:MAG: ABC transporter ATP-binding protein [Methanomassiliicoccus sp.]|nr:ABC transporter ATP-binding protein [Methanomassiliicoccus sp.]
MVETSIILEIEDLRVEFIRYDGVVQALDGVDVRIRRSEVFGLVGETGCGKSVTAECILRLLPMPPGRITSGHIFFSMPDDSRSKMMGLKNMTEDESVHPSSTEDGHLAARLELDDLIHKWDMLARSDGYMRKIRGNLISMIFQDPMSSLNPVLSIGEQMSEVMLAHERKELASAVLRRLGGSPGADGEDPSYKEAGEESPSMSSAGGFDRHFLKKMSEEPDAFTLKIASRVPLLRRFERLVKEEALNRSKAMLESVNIADPVQVLNSYPFELSGGMQQRVMIAMALACRPWLLIADEPTTALDVTIQAQILKLIKDMQRETGTSVLLITHNLGVVAETCYRVGVMYAGVVVETAATSDIFRAPLHPYTQGLIRSIPGAIDRSVHLEVIKGTVPDLIHPPSGCRFHPRCPQAMERCSWEKPRKVEVRPGHEVCCHLYGGEGTDGR